MAGTWPDTVVEAPDGVRLAFTLASGLTPFHPLVFVGGLQTNSFTFAGPVMTLTGIPPAAGESIFVYFSATGSSAYVLGQAGTWPDTTVEAADGIRTTFTLVSGFTPTNPLVTVGRFLEGPTDYTLGAGTITFSFAPVAGEAIYLYYQTSGVSIGYPGVDTLGSLRATIRQRADLVGDQFVTDVELNGYINNSLQQLYDILIQAYGNDYYIAAPKTYTTDGTNELYPLAADFYKSLGVETQTGTNRWVDIPRFNFQERNRGGAGGRTNLRYRLLGANLWLRSGASIPAAGIIVRQWYAPRLMPLINDGDTVDGFNGWEELAVLDSIVKCRLKAEEDASGEMALMQQEIKRIEDQAENRDESGPQTVANVRGGGAYSDFVASEGWD